MFKRPYYIAVALVAKRNRNADGDILDGWQVRVLDAAGRYQLNPGEDTEAGILRFAKSNAGF